VSGRLIKSLRHGRHDAGTDQRERKDVGLDRLILIKYMITVSALDASQWTERQKQARVRTMTTAAKVRRAYCSM